MLCRTELQAKEAWTQIEPFLGTLGLSLSPTKTHVTTFLKGVTFRGFDVQSHSVKMRAKSVENFQTKVREITTRSHNLDAEVITKLNSVMRGVQRYFGTWFSFRDMVLDVRDAVPRTRRVGPNATEMPEAQTQEPPA